MVHSEALGELASGPAAPVKSSRLLFWAHASTSTATSPMGLFDQVVAAVAQGLSVRGAERALDKAVEQERRVEDVGGKEP
jgi:hypothetical protein